MTCSSIIRGSAEPLYVALVGLGDASLQGLACSWITVCECCRICLFDSHLANHNPVTRGNKEVFLIPPAVTTGNLPIYPPGGRQAGKVHAKGQTKGPLAPNALTYPCQLPQLTCDWWAAVKSTFTGRSKAIESFSKGQTSWQSRVGCLAAVHTRKSATVTAYRRRRAAHTLQQQAAFSAAQYLSPIALTVRWVQLAIQTSAS